MTTGEQIKVPWGLLNEPEGDLVHAKNARKGLRYLCPGCLGELVPVQDEKVTWHFRHKADTSSCSLESAEHWAAKHLVAFVVNHRLEVSLSRRCSSVDEHYDSYAPPPGTDMWKCVECGRVSRKTRRGNKPFPHGRGSKGRNDCPGSGKKADYVGKLPDPDPEGSVKAFLDQLGDYYVDSVRAVELRRSQCRGRTIMLDWSLPEWGVLEAMSSADAAWEQVENDKWLATTSTGRPTFQPPSHYLNGEFLGSTQSYSNQLARKAARQAAIADWTEGHRRGFR